MIYVKHVINRNLYESAPQSGPRPNENTSSSPEYFRLVNQNQNQNEKVESLKNLLENVHENSGGFFKELKTMKKTPIQRPEVNNFLSESSRLIGNENLLQKNEEISAKEKLQKEILVAKWLDYSTKYGIGYSLTNGNIGVLFNDSSKIITKNETFFYYIEKKKDTRHEQLVEYHIHNCPLELEKKALLMKHFKSYLTEREVYFF